MSKGKHREYRDENGSAFRFDQIAFRSAVEHRARQTRRSSQKVISDIAVYFYGENPTDSNISKISKWKTGKYHPSNINDARTLETFFQRQFLVAVSPCTTNNEKDTTGMNIVNTTSVTSNSRFASSAEERTAAKAAYTIATNLISSYTKLMYIYACADFPFNGVSKECLPQNLLCYTDICNKIHTLRFDLPQDMYLELMNLIRTIYGPFNSHCDTLSNDNCWDMSAEHDDFVLFLKKTGQMSNDIDKWYSWIEYTNMLAEEYRNILEDIFEDYLK
jgi:hypothetical protein